MGKSLADAPVGQFSNDDANSGQLPAILARLAQDLGPVFKRRLKTGPYAGQEMVFLVGPEANRFVLHTHRAHFSHDQGWTPAIGEFMGHGLLNLDDPEHAAHRKIWSPAFTTAYMETYLPLMQEVIARHTATWPAQDPVDLYNEAREITFEIAATALAGVPQGPQVEHMQRLFYTLISGTYTTDRTTYEARMQAAMAARDELTGLLLRLITERRAAPPAARPRDVVSLIVHTLGEDGQTLSNAQVLGHLNILLVAGHETTTMLGAWVLYLLATQTEQRRRVEAELDALLGDSPGPIGVEAVRGMKLLDNFIREAGRLHPPVFVVPRGVVEEVEFAGYTLPVGTPVRLAIAGSQRLPTVFADPARFDPDRFAPPREEDKRTPYSLVTFGGGSRVCIGINFANIEVKVLAAHVLRHYHLAPASDHEPVQAGFFATLMPGGLPMRVTPR